MTKRLKIFAILSIALLLSCCFIFAGCKDRAKDKKDAIVIPEEAVEAPTIKSLVVEEKEDFEVKDGVVHLYEDDFTFKDGHIITNSLPDLCIGRVVLLDYAKEQDEAYKITDWATKGDQYALSVENATEITDVYNNINVNKVVGIEEGNYELISDAELIAQIENAAFTEHVAGLFESAPSINIDRKDIDKENGIANIDFTISLPIYTKDGVTVTLSVTLKNEILVDTAVNFQLIPLNFDLGADMVINTKAVFKLGSAYNISKIEGMEDVISKLVDAFGGNPDDLNLTIFTWSYPVGPLLLTYDLDARFKVNFSGEFGVETESTAAYTLGASYDSEKAAELDNKLDAFSYYAIKGDSNKIQLTKAELYGTLKTEVGIVNTLRLDILAIAGVGLKLDTGLYADLYGAVEINVNDISQTVGGYYLDCGLYYSVDLLAGLNIVDIIKLDKTFNLVSGRYQLFDLGAKSFDVAFANVPALIEVNSDYKVMPIFSVKKFDLINRNEFVENIDFEDYQVVLKDNSYVTYGDGVINVKDTAPAEFTEDITLYLVSKPQVYTTITLERLSTVPVALKSVKQFTKSVDDDVTFDIDLKGAEFVSVSGNDVEYTYNNGIITIDHIYLSKLANGRYDFTVTTSVNEFTVYVNVLGNVNLFSDGTGTSADPYRIYSADQLVELSVDAAKNNYYNNKYFILDYDVNMDGIAFAPVSKFAGNFNGNGHKIYNYTIDTVIDGNAGFFARNDGTIKNLTVDGVVRVNEQIVNAGAIAGLNNGTVKDCKVTGNVIVSGYKTKASKHAKYNVGGAVGYNSENGTVKNVTCEGIVTAEYSGNSLSSVIYLAGVVGYNDGTTENISSTSTLNFSDDFWKRKNTHSNEICNNAE